VSDWCDARTAHPDPDAEWDRSNGRVYRVQARDAKKFSPPDLTKLSSEKLVGLLGGANDWLVRKARRLLADRRDATVVAALRENVLKNSNEHLALESLWALYVSGGFDDALAKQLLAHANPNIRFWTVRFLGDEGKALPELTKLAMDEKDVRVRSQLASTARRSPAAQGLDIVEQLVLHHDDTKDLHLPLLLWWAVEHHVIDGRERVLEFFTACQQPLAREFLRPRVMRRYAAEGDLVACAKLLRADASLLSSLDQGMRESTKGDVAIPAELTNELPRLWKDQTNDVKLIAALARLKFAKAQSRAETLAADRVVSPDVRVPMVELVPVDKRIQLLDPAEPEAIRIAALAALSGSADSEIMDRFGETSGPVRAKAAEVLLSRKEPAGSLLRAIDAGKFPKDAVSLEQVRHVASYNDSELNAIVRTHWGALKSATPEEKLADVRRFNNDLRAASGDAKAGAAIFGQACATCHRLYDAGGDVGPDLTHANRKDRDYLLVSIVDPNAVVRSEHLAYVIKTTDGRVLTGLIAEQTPASVTLKNANNLKTTVQREKISEMKESPLSLMPEGLLSAMKPQQLRDLFSYLQSEGKP
jgi:putative heme-binding domain-containing protein